MIKEQDIEIIRGDDVTVTLYLLGDYTSKTAYFTVKEKDDLTGVRYIDLSTSSGIAATYDDTRTKFIMTIPKANTSGLTFNWMVYDLTFDEDTTKITGKVKLIHEYRSPTDSTVIPDTFATSSIVVQRPTASGVTLFNVSAIEDVYDETTSGDLVIVKKDQDAGDNLVQLKDGVNWVFMGNPTIAGDSASGTYGDANSAVNVHFSGDVNITNSNGLGSRIILQHASSDLNGFHWEFRANIIAGSEQNITIRKIYKNTLGGLPVFTRDSAGVWQMTLSEAFKSDVGNNIALPEKIIINIFGSPGEGIQIVYFTVSWATNDRLQLTTQEFITGLDDRLDPYDQGTIIKDFYVKVYPEPI